jgi:tRNA dimethylallyltransferase
MAAPVDNELNKKSVQYNDADNRGEPLPLVVIVGPTASGKSATAMRIAEEFDGEIICADSRTVYKYLDIGTAKPTVEDQRAVPHWGLDLVEPGTPFTAADFKYYAQQKIAEIRARGHVPMLVGGTGLYVDGLIFDYEFGAPEPKLRETLEALSLDDLIKYCTDNNISLPENQQNRRYVIRAIEQKSINNKRLMEPIDNTIVVGIATEREILRDRIKARAEQLFETGMVEEAKMLGEKYGWDSEAMTGNVYRLVRQYLNGEFDEAGLKERFITADWQLAKRQLTWLKRNPHIHWASLDDAYLYIKEKLINAPETE